MTTVRQGIHKNVTGAKSDKTDQNSSPPVEDISHEERILVILRDELYDGSWQIMEKDLEDRLEGRPYIFKLHNRIEEDLERIEKLKEFEEEHEINLADFIEALEEEE